MEIGCHPGMPYPSDMLLFKICMKRHRINLLWINSKKIFQDIISLFLSIFALFGNILLAINTVGSMKPLCRVYWYPSLGTQAKEHSIFYHWHWLIRDDQLRRRWYKCKSELRLTVWFIFKETIVSCKMRRSLQIMNSVTIKLKQYGNCVNMTCLFIKFILK